MSDKVYFICDDSGEPLDPYALSVESMNTDLYLSKYSNTDWTFESQEECAEFICGEFCR